jgi:hypothetical protein
LVILAVVIAIGSWVAFHTYWTDETVPTALQGEAATNSYYSVERLARALGIRTQKIASLRVLPPRDDVLLISDLTHDAARARLGSLERWVESGGRLAVTANVVWSTPALQTWSGIAPAHREPKQPAGASPGLPNRGPLNRRPLNPGPSNSAQDPPLQILGKREEDCAPMSVQTDGVSSGEIMHICSPASVFGFASKRRPSWALSNDAGMQLLRVSIGDGSLTVVGPGFLLGPKAFLRRDNAQAFIDATQLERGGRLSIFSASVAEPLVAMLWRRAAPAVVFFGVAISLMILRHLPRFGPPAPVPAAARRSLAEQIRANARFAWRTGNLSSLRRAVLRSLDRSAGQRIAGYGSLTARRRAVEIGKRAGVDSTVLNSAMTEAAAGAPSVQRSAIVLLEQTRRALNKFPTDNGNQPTTTR